MGSIIGGIIGNEASGDDRRAARDSASMATGAFRDITPPSIEEQQIKLKLLQQMGVLSPELEQAINLAPSKMEDISTDPKIRDAQLQALETLKNLGNTGLSSQDMANLNAIRNDTNQQVSARNQAILQNQAQRGTAGSGNELAAQLQASQSGANRASNEGDSLAAQSQNRALQAIANSGTLAGQMNSQDFNQNAAKAQAQDAIARFNAANSQDVQGRNVGRNNMAQQYNLGEQQHIADTNVGLQNQQEIHNKGLYQQQFNNQMARAQGLAGQYRQNQDMQTAEGQRVAKMWSGIGQGVDKGVAMVGSGGLSDIIGGGSGGGSSGGMAGGAGDAGTSISGDAPIMFASDGGMIASPRQYKDAMHHIIESPQSMDEGGIVSKLAPLAMMLLKDGGQVPGKAPVSGDSLKNDVVPTMLSPGEVVVPRTVVAQDPAHIAAFVEHAKHQKNHEVAMQSLTAINAILKNMKEKK